MTRDSRETGETQVRQPQTGGDEARQYLPVPRLYNYFDAIIKHGSIRGAAQALRIASSALNRRILDLERDLGCSLFDRVPSGVRLTAAGETFAAHVRRTLMDLRLFGDQIQSLSGRISGHIVVGAAESAAMEVLPKVMEAFEREHPGVQFILDVGTPGEMLKGLLNDQMDMILTHQEPKHHDVVIRSSAATPFCALMRREHPLAVRDTLSIEDCSSFPHVLAQENLEARAMYDATLSAGSLTAPAVLVTNMFEVMKTYIRLTDAISFQFSLAELSSTGLEGIVALPLADEHIAGGRLTLAVRRGRELPPAPAAFRDRLAHILDKTAR